MDGSTDTPTAGPGQSFAATSQGIQSGKLETKCHWSCHHTYTVKADSSNHVAKTSFEASAREACTGSWYPQEAFAANSRVDSSAAASRGAAVASKHAQQASTSASSEA